jgi:hypothetical protein
MKIEFKKHTISKGKNGYGITTGVHLLDITRLDENNEVFGTVSITPSTTKVELFNGWVEIPVESIPELIHELNKIYDRRKDAANSSSSQKVV